MEPPASFGEAMDSLVEPRWPPGLEVMKVSAAGRVGAPGCQREAGPAVRGPGARGRLGPGCPALLCRLPAGRPRGSGPPSPGPGLGPFFRADVGGGRNRGFGSSATAITGTWRKDG